MHQRIARIAVLVKDYDEAINFYVNKLDFELIEDTELSDVKRWVVVSPPGATECSLLLAKAANENQLAAVGNQTGGRVFFFLYTDDFDRDYKKYSSREIEFISGPDDMEYGKVAVFKDIYGNKWDLIQPKH